MKVIRMKKGVKLTMSDSEYEALQYVFDQGKGEMVNISLDETGLSPSAKAAMRKGPFGTINGLVITEDRRK